VGDKIRAAVVGVGHMGQYHVGMYADSNDVELVGVADSSRERAELIASKYGTRAFSDYEELLDEIDVVTIAVPTSLHYEVAKPFLEKGIHVLLEKPIATTVDKAKELNAIARSHALIFQIGFVERFNPAVLALLLLKLILM